MENKDAADILQVLQGIKNLTSSQKSVVVPVLCEKVIRCLYECVRTALKDGRIPSKTRSLLAKRLANKKRTLRFIADHNNCDYDGKRKAAASLGGKNWSVILRAIFPLLTKVLTNVKGHSHSHSKKGKNKSKKSKSKK